jgi:hypothetical protein
MILRSLILGTLEESVDLITNLTCIAVNAGKPVNSYAPSVKFIVLDVDINPALLTKI